jgi:hypothetical protein
MGRKDLILGKTPGGLTIMITEAAMQDLIEKGIIEDKEGFDELVKDFSVAVDAQRKAERGEQLTPEEAAAIGRIEPFEDNDPLYAALADVAAKEEEED